MARPNRGRTIGRESVVISRIAERREALGLTLDGLASRLTSVGCQIHPTAIWKLENGQRKLNVDELVAFAAVFEVSPADLLALPGEEDQSRLVEELSAQAFRALNRHTDAKERLKRVQVETERLKAEVSTLDQNLASLSRRAERLVLTVQENYLLETLADLQTRLAAKAEGVV